MLKAKALVLLTFGSVFGAGAVSALVATRYLQPEPPHSRPGPGGPPQGGGNSSWLSSRLGLNAEQSEKIQAIMSTVREENMERDRQRRELQKKVQDDLLADLSPEQRAKYEESRTRTEQAIAKLREESETAWKEADKKVNEFLTPEQITKMQELRSMRDRGPRGPEGRGRGGDHGGGTRPSTRPWSIPMGGPPPSGDFTPQSPR